MTKIAYNQEEYKSWIQTLKSRVQFAKQKVALSVNQQLIELYWELGKEITTKMENAKWGSGVIDKISSDLRIAFPDMKGFSRRNIYAIKQWYTFYSQKYAFVPQSVAQIPWGHHRMIVSKIKDIDEAIFYVEETAKNGWTRDTLEIQIENNYIVRKGSKSNNFKNTLPEAHSKIVSQALKDPYNFDFLSLQEEALEREIENQLTQNITDFLLELGKGFAFVGRQYKLEVSETDYFIDLLFYHIPLKCYVVIELKAGRFKPEFAGKLNFYLSAVDDLLKTENENPTIGLLLCKKKDKIEAEYALRDIHKPMGISEFKITEAIPKEIKTKLPSIEEIEREFSE
ncbi:YhcG family protein [Aureivirga sp. CE67]|uniref:PDDEXK nuclease domain-containing protein n=1 Tax=Aureivirga sp. CE67 TaxID=1788983 RepID=UPI0018CA1249|nr:PDDEXK nuclease domain-containing protein [Aureivirga sp. CE67]